MIYVYILIYLLSRLKDGAGLGSFNELSDKNLRMNLSRIKNLVKENGDKVILVENDEPGAVSWYGCGLLTPLYYLR